MKIAIISSYKVDCGIAEFTRFLETQLVASGHEVSIFALDLGLLKKEKWGGDKHISKICQSLSEFAAINLQLEYGLLGASYRRIISRFKRILTSHPRVIVTFHTVFALEKRLNLLSVIKSRNLSILLQYARTQQKRFFERRVFSLIRKYNAKVIVHTKRTSELIKQLYDVEAHFHPLFYINEKASNNLDKNLCRKELLAVCSVDSKDSSHNGDQEVLIGVFGFFGIYKGFDIAIRAIELLPPNYKLIIVGGFHPSAIESGDYSLVKKMTNLLIRQQGASKRVLFLGNVPNTAFHKIVKGVDFCWLPYREIGQEASGIASLCFELGEKLLLSRTNAFQELYRLYPRKDLLFCEIENYFELAFKTLQFDQIKCLTAYEQDQSLSFSSETQVKKYEELFSIS